MHCCKRVWKLPYTRLRRSSSIAATSSIMVCLSSWIVMIRHWNTRSFRNPHRKKSGTVRSGDRAGQAMSPKQEITVRNISRTTAILFRTVWNGVLSSTVPLAANHDKLSRRRNIQIRKVSVRSAPPCITVPSSPTYRRGLTKWSDSLYTTSPLYFKYTYIKKRSRITVYTQPYITCKNSYIFRLYRGADKSLARPGNKLMFLSEWREFPSAPCLAGKKKLNESSRLDVVEIARVPDMLPSLFPSWSG